MGTYTGYDNINYDPGEIIKPEIGEIGTFKRFGALIPKGALVELNSTGTAMVCNDVDTKHPLGVAVINDADVTVQNVKVLINGVATVVADSEITAGDALIPANDGRVRRFDQAFAPAAYRIVGLALSCADAGGVVVLALKSWGAL